MAQKRVAIVGSGCAGIGAFWALKDFGHDVHLYEADETLGGHTNTVPYRHGDKEVDVDTGFIVFNTATYRMSLSEDPAPQTLTAPSKPDQISCGSQCQDRTNRDDLWCLKRRRLP